MFLFGLISLRFFTSLAYCVHQRSIITLPEIQTLVYRGDSIVISNYDVSQLMKLVWEIQTYPVINFPIKVAGQVRVIRQN